jgi:hypothetical protein
MTLFLLLFLWVLPAHAAEAPAVATDSELHELEARALYQAGLQLMVDQAWDEAELVFLRLVQQYPDTEMADRAQAQLDTLALVDRRGGIDPNAKARAELIIDQAVVNAAFFGFLLPASTWQPSQPLGPVGMGTLGLSAGIVGGVVASKRYEPTQGQVMALFTGQWMGTANAFTASSIKPPRDYRGVYRYMSAGTVLGAAGGAAAGHFLEPSAGQMSMVNSGAVWGLYLGGWSYAYLEAPDWDNANRNRNNALRMTAFGDLGALSGALIAWKFPISRARMNLGNLGAVAGGLLGAGGAVLFDFYSPFGLSNPEQFYGAIIVPMTAVGGFSAVLLTRSLDEDRLAARWDHLELQVAAAPNGVGVSGRF